MMVSIRFAFFALPAAAFASVVVLPASAAAQATTSRPVVQQLPPKEVKELRDALRALNRAPNNVDALLNAGYASIKVNDLEAAMGYFGRAEETAPNDPRIQQAQATVFLRSGRPVQALTLFSQAEAAGAPERSLLSDRGLAHDMVGDQVRAQAFYREALRDTPSDGETIRRMAVSQAIGGNEAAFATTLSPLVEQKDFAAFRAQAFGLAILGEQDRAKAVTEAVMPSDLARRIVPYLGYMPRLTKAQQAAAANLGIFPKAADIGRENPLIAEYAKGATAAGATTVAATSADNRLEPAGQPLGRRAENAAPAVRAPTPSPSAAPAPAPAPAPAIAAAPARAQSEVSPGFDLGRANGTQQSNGADGVRVTRAGPALPNVTTRMVQPERKPDPSFADAFADMGTADTRSVVKAAEAVDIGSLDIPREAAPKPTPAKPKAPAHPQRYWVQLGTGQDAGLFKYDWARLARQASGDLSGLSGHYVPFGESFILLAGPVSNKTAMDELVGKLTEKGLGVLPYRSSEGQEVEGLK